MKKTLSLLTIASSLLLPSQANAKTEGSYLGLDLIRNSAQVKSNSNAARDQLLFSEYYDNKKSDTAYGVGISYKYAFNFNNFFVAPGVSYNLLTNDVKSSFASSLNDPYSQSMKLKSQLTFQTNFGYDINNQFSAYIPAGVSLFRYELNTSDDGGSGTVITTKKTGVKPAIFFGLGFAYAPVKNWVVNLEYNKFQNFKVNSPQATFSDGRIVAKTSVDALKLGISYKF
jgi:opacity protein-like surface antigen